MKIPRLNARLKFLGFTFFFMISQTQTVKGITSKLRNGLHMVLLDIDKNMYNLQQIIEFLKKIQEKYSLSNIYLLSDKEGSYRAWCFSQVDFTTYIKILADCLEIIDYNFFYWTIYQSKATLRISPKIDRLQQQKVIAVLESFYLPLPFNLLEKVVYDTGLDKLGIFIKLPQR